MKMWVVITERGLGCARWAYGPFTDANEATDNANAAGEQDGIVEAKVLFATMKSVLAIVENDDEPFPPKQLMDEIWAGAFE
jgi:hypothetical protein